MQAIEIDARIDERGEIHIKLPQGRPPGPARVIVLFDTDQASRPEPRRHMPSSRLADKGAKLHGDDIAPAFSQDEWGDLYQ
jgi:hypothetical protein